MGTEGKMAFKSLTLVNVIGQEYFNWINSLLWVSIQKAVSYIVTMPLFVLLFCIGILFFFNIHVFI